MTDTTLLHSQLGEDYHSFVYKWLFYTLMISSIQFLLLFKSPGIYKRILDKVFNMELTVFKTKLTIYFLIIIWIFFLLFSTFIIKLQLSDLQLKKQEKFLLPNGSANYYKDKWYLEAELWMLLILIIEWISIYRLMKLFTKRENLKEEIGKLKLNK